MRLILGECIDEMKCLISKGVKVDAIITDPPYFEIKGGFDFIYKSKEEFLIFFEEFVKLAFEILKDNGTFLFFGHWRNVAYKQVIADKYFKLENNGVWEKVDVKDVVNKAFSDIIIKYEEEHKNRISRETERILKLFKNERRDKKEKE